MEGHGGSAAPPRDEWMDIPGRVPPRDGWRDTGAAPGTHPTWSLTAQILILLLLRILRTLFPCMGYDPFLLQEAWERILCLLPVSGHVYIIDGLFTASIHLQALTREKREMSVKWHFF